MRAFFQTEYLGNSLGQWIIAVLIVIGSIILAKLLYFIAGKFLRLRVKKTKIKTDDIILKHLESPVIFAITIIGIWIGVSSLNYPGDLEKYISIGYHLLITFDAAWIITRTTKLMFEIYSISAAAQNQTKIAEHMFPVFRKILNFSIWFVALAIGINDAGYDVGAIIAGLGIGGLAVAMAAREFLANLFGGLTVYIDKPFIVGDRIKIENYDGYIKEIGLRCTRMQTRDGRMVTIPNSLFSSKLIENISSEPTRKVTLDIFLGFDIENAALEKALDLISKTAKNQEEILPEFDLILDNFVPSGLKIQFIYYIKKEENIDLVVSKVNQAIFRVLKQNNIQLPQ